MASPPTTPERWLRTFEAAVRARDFAAGLAIFADDAVAFGTWGRAVAGIDDIIHELAAMQSPSVCDIKTSASELLPADRGG
jgi:ketosteroid isomerase-like protein